MYTGRKYSGDSGYIGTELMSGASELEQHCAAVEKATREGYFGLTEALSVYKVDRTQYLAYLLLKKDSVKAENEQEEIKNVFCAVVEVFDPSSTDLNSNEKAILEKVKVFCE